MSPIPSPRKERSTGKTKRSAAPPRPRDLEALIGPPPLLPGENAAAYAALAERVRAYVEPRDIIEELLLDDFLQTAWDLIRCRRAKVNLLRAASHLGLARLLDRLVPWQERGRLVDGWARRDRDATEEVRRHLAQAGLDENSVCAETICIKLREFELLDNVTARAEVRRNGALSEIERHRDVLGMRAREASRLINTAEYKLIGASEAAE